MEAQTGDQRWGTFASKINQEFGGPHPRKGKKSDQAHPPIHPLKMAPGKWWVRIPENSGEVFRVVEWNIG